MNLTKTNRGSNLNTREYRKLHNISYSDIKLWITDRKLFYRKKILGEQIVEKTSVSNTIGSLIHCKVLEPENEQKLFCTAPVTVTGQMGLLAEAMYDRSVRYMDEEGRVTVNISTIIEEALNQVKYNNKGEEIAFKGKGLDKVIEMFSGSDAETLYSYLRANHGKTVITSYNDEQATRIVEELQRNEYTSKWINVVSSGAIEVHNEIPILFRHEGVEVKSLVDRMIIDHSEKKVYVTDVKSTWDSENFEKNYLQLCYYIQAILYHLAAKAYCIQQKIEDYTVVPMKYIVCDSQGYMQSVIYECTEEDLVKAYSGFTIGSRKYIGLKECLEDINHSINTGVWNIGRKAMLNQGVCKLEIPYQ